MKKGILIVISGPSGSGKGTVIKRIMEYDRSFIYSVSATTRAPRVGEKHGVNYYFIDRADFEARIAADMMLEHAEYCGNYYGTPKKEVWENLEAGRNVILEIEVEGAMQIKKKCPDALLVMITPPDFETLEARLRGRGDDVSEDVIQKRLATSKKELAKLSEYDYIVVNGDNMVDEAAHEIIGIVDAEMHRVSRNEDFTSKFFA
ncbi:MAG: guanylate kinase [Ruminococcaceae bacterium]|nr:guanylate kinase [Oscillospiraceae bacterium]